MDNLTHSLIGAVLVALGSVASEIAGIEDEVAREFAPYIGIERAYRFGRTAGFARAAGEDAHETRWVAGLRAWF